MSEQPMQLTMTQQSDFLYLEERLRELAHHIYRDTWNSLHHEDLLQLNAALEENHSTWNQLREVVTRTSNIARRRMHIHSNMETDLNREAVLILYRLLPMLRAARVLMSYLNYIQGPPLVIGRWRRSFNCDTQSKEIGQHTVSGVMEHLGLVRAGILMRKLRGCVQDLFPSSEMSVVNGL